MELGYSFAGVHACCVTAAISTPEVRGATHTRGKTFLQQKAPLAAQTSCEPYVSPVWKQEGSRAAASPLILV